MSSISTTVVDVVVVIVVGYLIGSIPVANLVARRRVSVDLREVGDRNPGFWNARETFGRKAAVPVFVGDVAKGVGRRRVGRGACRRRGVGRGRRRRRAQRWSGMPFPVFAGFRGGRSILTFVGGAAVFAPLPVAISVALLLVVFGITRSFAIAARVGMVALPFVQIVARRPVPHGRDRRR